MRRTIFSSPSLFLSHTQAHAYVGVSEENSMMTDNKTSENRRGGFGCSHTASYSHFTDKALFFCHAVRVCTCAPCMVAVRDGYSGINRNKQGR